MLEPECYRMGFDGYTDVILNEVKRYERMLQTFLTWRAR